MSRGTAPARAALLGNPSDGYGGHVVAFAFDAYAAEVVAEPAPAFAIDPRDRDAEPLLRAAARRAGDERVRLRWATTIPRQVGLGGSSALVIAALRALGIDAPPATLAELALAVEVDDLGIQAGLQDRVAQAYGGVVSMDFARRAYEPLDAALLPALYVAHQPGPAEPSGAVHATLRERHARDAEVRRAMERLADVALRGRDAIVSGDHDALARSVDATLDLRRELMPLDPGCLRAVELARGAGASANYAGSGGAIAGTGDAQRVRDALAPLGWEVRAVRPTAGTSAPAPAPSAARRPAGT